MEHSTFLHIVHLIRPRLEKRDTQLRKAIPIENLVGVALWGLSTGNSFRSIKKNGVGKSTAAQIAADSVKKMFVYLIFLSSFLQTEGTQQRLLPNSNRTTNQDCHKL